MPFRRNEPSLAVVVRRAPALHPGHAARGPDVDALDSVSALVDDATGDRRAGDEGQIEHAFATRRDLDAALHGAVVGLGLGGDGPGLGGIEPADEDLLAGDQVEVEAAAAPSAAHAEARDGQGPHEFALAHVRPEDEAGAAAHFELHGARGDIGQLDRIRRVPVPIGESEHRRHEARRHLDPSAAVR